MKRFLLDVAEVLEVGDVTPAFAFRDAPGWCSLKGFALLVLLENDYGRPTTLEAFLACRTVGDLARLAGLEGA